MIASIALFLAGQAAVKDVARNADATICRMYYNDRMADLALPTSQRKTDETYRAMYFRNDKKGALRKTCTVYFSARQDEAEYVLNRSRNDARRDDGRVTASAIGKRDDGDRARSGSRKGDRHDSRHIVSARAAAKGR